MIVLNANKTTRGYEIWRTLPADRATLEAAKDEASSIASLRTGHCEFNRLQASVEGMMVEDESAGIIYELGFCPLVRE